MNQPNQSSGLISALAGKPPPQEILLDVQALIRAYHSSKPDLSNPQQRVSFGTSGHRGTAFNGSFTESHVEAITQAVCEYRAYKKIRGPLILGRDTHALSESAQVTAQEVCAGNGIEVHIQENNGVTPTPVISHAILVWNRENPEYLADGLIITPSHNPPEDAGIKYNPPHGGPAESEATSWIEKRSNEILALGNRAVKRSSAPSGSQSKDLNGRYVHDLESVITMQQISEAKVHIGVDPLGGASIAVWHRIAERYNLNLEVVNTVVDPTFKFMSVDYDGKIRMDCSSPYAMTSLLALRNTFDVAIGNDPDADRHGIISPSKGLLNPNHYLAIVIDYLLSHRPEWRDTSAVGKTIVSSNLIDAVVRGHKRKLFEVPVGFKWFASGLHDGVCCFGGEESAGASFLQKDGLPWSTDKDGPLLGLLAAEIIATTGKDVGASLDSLQKQYGSTSYRRIDAPLSLEQKKKFSALTPTTLGLTSLGGEAIAKILDRAPGNNQPIGGFKVVTPSGWIAMRPSGTEPLIKLYGESEKSEEHLAQLLGEGEKWIAKSLADI